LVHVSVVAWGAKDPQRFGFEDGTAQADRQRGTKVAPPAVTGNKQMESIGTQQKRHCCARSERICCCAAQRATLTMKPSKYKRSGREAGRRTMMNLLKMMRIVLWSFFGVRKSASHESDFASVNVSLLPVMAVALAACFGLTLFGLVKLALTVAH
jgi:hypothetical protein